MPMDNLLQNLQGTIRALEALSDKGLAEADKIDELLDQLFQQKIDLANLNANTASPIYQQAAQALGQAASRAQRAIKDPNQVRDLLNVVSDAISKLGKLLNNVTT